MVKFFQTREGRLHGGRIAGVLYAFGLPVSCNFHLMQPRCMACIVFTVGWWLSFCDERSALTLPVMALTPVRITGIVLTLAGLAGQFYFVAYH